MANSVLSAAFLANKKMFRLLSVSVTVGRDRGRLRREAMDAPCSDRGLRDAAQTISMITTQAVIGRQEQH